MISSILPVHPRSNPFWGSSTGRVCIETFLKMVRGIEGVENHVVVTQDESVRQIALQYSMTVKDFIVPGCPDVPYTFEQIKSLLRNVNGTDTKSEDVFIVLDHRNLLLTRGDVEMALSILSDNKDSSVIGLSLCKDYPCQYKTFYSFLDCVITYFSNPASASVFSEASQTCLSKEITCRTKRPEEMTILVSPKDACCRLSFCCRNEIQEGFVVQIIPIGVNGPIYEKGCDLFLSGKTHEIILDIEIRKLIGLIAVLNKPSRNGEYDTIESFAPSGASWKFEGPGNMITDAKTHKRMNGRQLFPPAFTCDGSLCILNSENLPGKTAGGTIPLMIGASCIVTDWVDYWRSLKTSPEDI